jgi:surface protein
MRLVKFTLLIYLVVGTFNSCKKSATELPKVFTGNPKVSIAEIILSGEVTFTGGENSTKRGFCWSESSNPTINDNYYSDASTGIGAFSFNAISKLKPRTKYYVRAFAENSVGKSYGEVVSFISGFDNFKDAFINSRGCIECDKYQIGDTFLLNGIYYVVADRDILDKALDKGDDLTKYCTSKVDNMNDMFQESKTFNQDIRNWDVSNVITMLRMFYGAEAFNQDIGNWDVSNVITMFGMFADAKAFNQDIRNWDVSNVKSTQYMFYGAEAFNQDIGKWNVSNIGFTSPGVTGMDLMFNHAKAFNQDLSRWCVKNITKLPSQFSWGSALTPENHPVWGTCP